MAGFGTASGGGRKPFGSIGGNGPLSVLKKEGACVPFSDPTNIGPPLSIGDEWPEWIKGSGCGTIAILKMNEIVNKDTATPKKILTPKNVKTLRECVKKCTKGYDIAGGLPSTFDKPISVEVIRCIIQCKKEIMYGHEVEVDVSAFGWSEGDPSGTVDPSNIVSSLPDTLCPPLCNNAYAALMMNIGFKIYKFIKISNIFTGEERIDLSIDHQHKSHAALGKVVSCEKGKKVCFALEDFVPQVPHKGVICVGPNGVDLGGSTYGLGTIIGLGAPAVRPAGGCIKEIQALGGKKGYHAKHGNYCLELEPSTTKIISIYMDSPKTNCEDTPK